MNIVVWLKGRRGCACLRRVLDEGHAVAAVVLQNQPATAWYAEAQRIAAGHGLRTMAADDPGDDALLEALAALEPDLFILAGYGRIIPPRTIALPRVMCLNLHGGRLPEYRGSSPMNWSLINGERSFSLSVIRVDPGVDSGDVFLDRTFPIGPDDTIADLHAIADREFPDMLCRVLRDLAQGTATPRVQDADRARYFPMRFPEDGLILWDQCTAEQAHNRVRALTEPYPCAFTYYRGRRVRLVATQLRESAFFGEPGRIYLVRDGRLLVCASDRCLWITRAVLEDTGEPLADAVKRYDRLATVRQAVMDLYERG
ncbi:MAG: methionyl-tRNA formyltransferase [Desulfovibrionaceae bacterium]|jgi:methionyl-tRNA formyltransferase|nr:methionyl-tRNA formyltransferase [Desulfovibrionaceae bacterium]